MFKASTHPLWLVLLLAASPLGNILLAQGFTYTMNTYNAESGLPSSGINCIHKDKAGFIWLGTREGLCRFDGFEFKRYLPEEEDFRSKAIHFIFEAKDGLFWLVNARVRSLLSNVEIDIFDPVSQSVKSYREAFDRSIFPAEEEISYIKQLNGVIWLGTSTGRLFSYHGHNLLKAEFDNKNKFPIDNFFLPASDKTFWHAVKNKIHGMNEVGHIRKEVSLPFPVFDITVDEKGEIFFLMKEISSQDSLIYEQYYTIGKDDSPAPVSPFDLAAPKELHFNNIHMLLKIEESGLIWSVGENGFRVINAKKHELVLDVLGLLQDKFNTTYINSYYFYRGGEILLNMGRALVNLSMAHVPFKTYLNTDNNLYSVRSMAKDKDGFIYASTYSGLVKIDPATEKIISTPLIFLNAGGGLFFYDPNTLLIGTHGNKWYKLDINTGHYSAFKCDFSQPFKFFRDRVDNTIYVGTRDGLGILDTLKNEIHPYENYNQFTSLSGSEVRCFYQNKNGIWIGTDSGIYLLEKGKGITHWFFRKSHDIEYANIQHIHEDEAGYFWIAVSSNSSGLFRWKPYTDDIKIFTKKDGLSDNNLHAVYEDERKRLWLSSDSGLMCLDKKTFKIKTFYKSSGLPENEFNYLAHYYDRKQKKLYFGGINGIVSFNPNDLEFDPAPDFPHLYLSEFNRLNVKTGKFEDETKEVLQKEEIVLRPKDRSFQIKFSTLDLLDPAILQFGWMIEGIHGGWIVQKENSIFVNDLPYGDFHLKVKVQTAGNPWSPHIYCIPLIVKRPFYLTWNFFLLASFLGALIFFAYFRLRLRSLLKAKANLEKTVEHRTKVIEEQRLVLERANNIKHRLMTILAHDMRSAVLSFKTTSKKLKYFLDREEFHRAQEVGKLVDNTADNLHGLLENLLEWTLSDLDNFPFEPAPVHIEKIVHRVTETFEPLASEKGVEITYVNDCREESILDEKAITSILANLIGNALKFTGEGGKVTIKTWESSKFIYISIEDTGVGMTEYQLAHLYDPDKQKLKKGTSGERGTGLGMLLVKNWIDKHNGVIAVESKPEKGTNIVIKIPQQSNSEKLFFSEKSGFN